MEGQEEEEREVWVGQADLSLLLMAEPRPEGW